MAVKIIRQGGVRVPSPAAPPQAAKPAITRPTVTPRPASGVRHPRIAPQARDGAVILSVLVPTVPGREGKLARLLLSLDPQVMARSDVELLVLRDCRGMTIGEKRSRMVALARGEYVAFVDDDDSVAPDYVETIVAHLGERPDVVCFEVVVNGHGPTKTCYYGLSLENKNLPDCYHRKPNHLMAWRRDLAVSVPFPAMRTGEDTAWANQICARASKEIRIPRPLYSYDYDPADNSATPRPPAR